MTIDEHRTQAQLLDKALDESCSYAQQVWLKLAAMRQYLYDSLPPEPAAGTSPGGAAPRGPHDDAGWEQWQAAFADVTSTLSGPRGDSGYGHTTAGLIAQARRHQSPDPAQDSHPSTDSDDEPPSPGAARHRQEDSSSDSPDSPGATTDDQPLPGGSQQSMQMSAAQQPLYGPFLYGALGATIRAVALRFLGRRAPA